MKKRLIALLLCCVMLLTLSPSLIATAAADDDTDTAPAVEEPVAEEQVKEPVKEPVEEEKTETKAEEPVEEEKTETKVEIGAENDAYAALLNKLLATESMDAFKAAVKSLSDEEAAALEVWLTDTGRYAELEAHCADLAALLPPPETRVFTDAGPFMPAVTVTPSVPAVRRVQGTSTQANDTKGIVLNKSVKAKGNGMYTITLESYTTGTVTTVTKTTPVDIVLVLDQSGSMADAFGNTTRQKAMQTAVKSFIEEVSKKYSAEADHRMAIVTFGSNASTLQDWTCVDASGKNTLQGKINGLPNSPSGATNAGEGMKVAETLMGSGYNYTGTNTSRQKVVIFFTDGVPTTGTAFNTGVADTAIAAAKRMKESGVTVYSVGIFNGADPEELYGEKWAYKYYNDIACTGEVGTYWGGSWMADLSGDIAPVDVPAGNRFLNYISTNFVTADSIGVERGSYRPGHDIGATGTGYKITKNFDRQSDKYYLTAEDSTSLNNIFQTISQNIQTSDISLDYSTQIKDIITPQFTAPANAQDINLYTDDYNGKAFKNDPQPASGVTAKIEGRTVTVTDFNFNENFVSENKKADGTFGKKLIIEFTVQLRSGFLGGNNVPTNGDTSGVYDKDGNEVKKFEVPAVNIPIGEVNVTAQDKNVYLLGSVTADQLKSGAEIKVGNVTLDLSKASDAAMPWGLEPWQTAYVDIKVAVKDAKGNAVPPAGLTKLADNTTYTIEVTVEPKNAAASTSSGDEATKQTGENTPAANIYVFKPEVTFKDSQITLGESAVYENNFVSAVWKHNGTQADPKKMIGEEPKLEYVYAPTAGIFKTDTPVTATVKIGSIDVTDKVTFVHEKCTIKDNCTLDAEDGQFIVHVKPLSLTITKTGADSRDANQSFVFVVSNDRNDSLKIENLEVIVHGDGSVTLNGLPTGTYTVTEKTGWSWRYKPADNNQDVELTATDTGKTITFANTRDNPSLWLTGGTYCDNRFGGQGTKVTPTNN